MYWQAAGYVRGAYKRYANKRAPPKMVKEPYVLSKSQKKILLKETYIFCICTWRVVTNRQWPICDKSTKEPHIKR